MEQRPRDQAVTTGAVRGGWRRWEPLTGIAFAVLFVAGFLVTGNSPSDSDSNRVWTNYYSDRGHQALVVVSAYMLVIAGLCLLAFLATLWTRIVSARRPHLISPLGLIAAGVAAACIAVGAVAQAAVSGAMIFGSTPEPGPDTLRLVFSIMYPFIMVAGMMAATVSVATLSIQAYGAGLLGRTLLVLSLIVAVGLLGSVFFFPMALLPIWALVMTVVLVRRGTASPDAIAEPVTAQLSGTVAARSPATDGQPAHR
jgi:MFS family permease